MKIIGTGSAHPKCAVTNEMLEKFLDTSDEWITERTGIKERCVISSEKLEDLAVIAANKALEDAGLTAADIDFIICSNVVNEYVTPALSCIIQGKIGATCPTVDINAACAGFVFAMDMAEDKIQCKKAKNILIVCAEEPSRMVSWKNRSTCVLFGDGAGAMVVTASEDGIDDVISIDIRSDGSIGDLISLELAGQNCPLVEPREEKSQFIKMNGKEVYRFVARVLPEYVEQLVANAGMKNEDIDYLIPHQANMRIIQAVQERLGYSDEKVVTNIERFGNTSAASIPLALVESVEQGKVKLGSTAILTGFGAGMTWGGAIVRLREGIC